MTSTTAIVVVNADTGTIDAFVASEAVIREDSKRVLAAQPHRNCSFDCAEQNGGNCPGVSCVYRPDKAPA